MLLVILILLFDSLIYLEMSSVSLSQQDDLTPVGASSKMATD